MKFSINSMLLWPKNTTFSYRQIPFKANKINIITGASRTGKSAIIPIIDYCLGSDKCAIPVDTIRNSCEWFGVLFDLTDEQMLLCRKSPEEKNTTGEMYCIRANCVNIPKVVESNTTVTAVKNMLNELFAMSFLDLDPITNNFSSRPSYRDFMAFIFQPQNIVANADVLFYKADTTEHRQKLINIFPYALGAVTPQVLAARQEIEKLKKERERLSRDLANLQNVSDGWKQEINSWISRAKELGLTTYSANDNDSFEEKVHQLSLIAEKSESDSTVLATNIKDMSDEIILLRKEEQKISSQLFTVQKRYSEMKQLTDSVGQYDNSLQIQLNRLEISTWLRSLASEENICPICGNSHNETLKDLDTLCNAIQEIKKTAGDLKVIPAAFERELHVVEAEIQLLSEKLSAIKRRITEESGKYAADADKKYTLTAISRFLGRIEVAIQTYERIGKDGELEQKIGVIDERLNKLNRLVNEGEIRRKIDAALRYINLEAGKILTGLDAEHPNDPIEFIIKDLTIRVKNKRGRDDYLWEIGSASNWLSYHVAVILAFQRFFQERGSVSVPNFIIFDQPSQVYFPRVLARKATKEEEDIALKDEDKEAVRKIFLSLSKYIVDAKIDFQILVTEHADDDVWGEIDHIHLVERWRGNNKKLIPVEWLESQ